MSDAVRKRYAERLRQLGVDSPSVPNGPFSGSVSHVPWLSADWPSEEGTPQPVIPQRSGGRRRTADVDIDNGDELQLVWQRYVERGDQRDRDQLIVHYSPLVKYVASRLAAGLPQSVDQSDLVSYGMFGLIDAITKFDLERGFKFETYAIARIKGAILDELRSIDWVPRSVRAKAKAVERAMASLEAGLRRAPNDDEIAAELQISTDALHGIYTQVANAGLVALDEMLSFGGSSGESMTLGDTLADRGSGPGTAFEQIEMRQLLANAINRMPEREKLVLTLYYYESLTLAEIGRVLGVTESRVCQIHTKAVLHLRSRLTAADRELV
jgi:RNA polymerase sigma factor FliA